MYIVYSENIRSDLSVEGKMKKKELYIYQSNNVKTDNSESTEYITLDNLFQLCASREILKKIFRYKMITFYCRNIELIGRPFIKACLCRMLTLGKCIWIDESKKRISLNIFTLFKMFIQYIRDHLSFKSYLRTVNSELDTLLEDKKSTYVICDGIPLYLRCDMPSDFIAGGSVGHIAGVLNNIEKCCGKRPVFVTADIIPTTNRHIETILVKGNIKYSNVCDFSGIAFNELTYEAIEEVVKEHEVSFIYQRSALDGYAGIKCAIKYHLPLVLEYNGSEVWIANKWGGRKLRYKNISEKIEQLTFQKADLITCVSTPLKEQLIEIGVEPCKVIVTPNGVNPEMYYPEIDGQGIRKKLGIDHHTIVIGFIGTYGAWHGAELLTQAFADLISNKECAAKIHLLLVGDGLKMPEVKNIVKTKHIEELCSLTGIIPQNEGPSYLAACDILVNPTIPNPDGTPFFGSPTKLFEYMAMGKSIVASNMDQMAEVLDDRRTALLSRPGDVEDLKQKIDELICNKELRQLLGKAAREEVCREYTWEIHTKKIIDALHNILGKNEMEQ